MVQNSGNYWLQLIDNHCSGIPLLVIALVECLSLSYIYGMARFVPSFIFLFKRTRGVISIFVFLTIRYNAYHKRLVLFGNDADRLMITIDEFWCFV